MIGYEDEPERSAEICVCEIFGRDVAADHAAVGMGVHPFGDPRIRDEFAAETVLIDGGGFHTYSVEWTRRMWRSSWTASTSRRSASLQLPDAAHAQPLRVPDDAGERTTTGAYPKEFVVDYVRGYRRVAG